MWVNDPFYPFSSCREYPMSVVHDREAVLHSASLSNVHRCVDELRAYVEKEDYAGYDPYDAMNSPLIRRLGTKSEWVQIGATQFLQRFPVNIRPILGIPKGHNPKGIGLFLSGYSRLYALTKEARHLERVEYLLAMLARLRSKGFSGNCWGYNFDWRNRVMFVPKYTPTIVNSAFIGHALLDTYLLCHVNRALDMAVPIKDFIINDLNRYYEADRFCFSYTPADGNFVHNANLLGASLLIRLRSICGDSHLERESLASLGYSLDHQRSDGAWQYAQTEIQGWVDSFHTGFNLQALQYFLAEGYGSRCERQYERGLKYYEDHFFLADGTPKYYDRGVLPIDIHSPCQAIVVFAREAGQRVSFAARIAKWMLDHMYSGRGYFYFRKGRFYTNRIPYMRWSQAWAFHALTSLLHDSTTPAPSKPVFHHAHLD
jgi:hypothetical protein